MQGAGELGVAQDEGIQACVLVIGEIADGLAAECFDDGRHGVRMGDDQRIRVGRERIEHRPQGLGIGRGVLGWFDFVCEGGGCRGLAGSVGVGDEDRAEIFLPKRVREHVCAGEAGFAEIGVLSVQLLGVAHDVDHTVVSRRGCRCRWTRDGEGDRDEEDRDREGDEVFHGVCSQSMRAPWDW